MDIALVMLSSAMGHFAEFTEIKPSFCQLYGFLIIFCKKNPVIRKGNAKLSRSIGQMFLKVHYLKNNNRTL